MTALLEGVTGLALVALPSRLATLLLGSSLEAPAAVTLARVAGMALVALAVTCWLARHDGQSRAARGLVAAMALYHTGVAIVLAYAEYRTRAIRPGPVAHGTVSRGHDRVVPQDRALNVERKLDARNGFKTFIVSGGGVEFMRGWAERVYGIPPEQVIGSSGKLRLDWRDRKPVLIKLPEIEFIDDKEGKPVGIQSRIGRRPIAAFGNSDGDLQMLQWTMAGGGARFALFVHHDDAIREFAYDRTDKLQQFDKGWDEAVAKGWTVVSMKNDWKTVYPGALP